MGHTPPVFKVMPVFVSWSGGKDCGLACYHAIKNGLDVRYLVSTIDKTGRLGAHALKPSVLEMQAQAIGIPLIKIPVTVDNYDNKFRNLIYKLKKGGIRGGVFGDVNLGNGEAKIHKQWIDSVCKPNGINSYLPLWDIGREKLIKEIIELGFDVIIIVAEKDRLGEEWLGRRLDKGLLGELKRRYELSPTGDVGYYHTFVVDGPIFKHRLEILEANSILRCDEWGSNCYMDIKKCQLREKGRCL